MIHYLAKPFNFEGKEYTEVKLDLDGLTGKDMSVIKRQWAVEGNYSPTAATDMSFCAQVASKASSLPCEFFEALPAKEYMRLTQEVSNFLLT